MTANKNENVGGLLLAAGGSRRMGQPKQLLKFEGKTLLRRAAESLVSSVCDPIVVVLGAEFDQSQAEIADLPVSFCRNENWQSGMSSSIREGLERLLSIRSDLAAVLITLCDQPRVTADKLDLFAKEFRRSNVAIIAAEYSETLGVPAMFSREMFAELFQLEGDKGARDLIRGGEDITRINLPEAAYDIDTISDFEHVAQTKISARLD